MAKSNAKRITSLSPSTFAVFQGTFAALLGLGVAFLQSFNATVNLSAQTNSVLAGLTLGIVSGAVLIFVLPLVYFAFGWVLGYLQGWIYNAVLGAAGGIVIELEDEVEKK